MLDHLPPSSPPPRTCAVCPTCVRKTCAPRGPCPRLHQQGFQDHPAATPVALTGARWKSGALRGKVRGISDSLDIFREATTLAGIRVNLSHYLLENGKFHKQEELPEPRVYAAVGAKLQRARGGSTAP